jgi:hypothetical protein
MNKRALADLCVVAAFMKRASRLPGQKALKKSIALGKRLAKSCDSFVNLNSFVEGNELSASVHVARVLDVAAAFTLERGRIMPRVAEGGVVMHSVISHEEALVEIENLPEGTVGMRVGISRADAFIRKGKTYDRISQNWTGEWMVRTSCDERGLVDDGIGGLEDAELIIFSHL